MIDTPVTASPTGMASLSTGGRVSAGRRAAFLDRFTLLRAAYRLDTVPHGRIVTRLP
mgnify:CR=1 FL=1